MCSGVASYGALGARARYDVPPRLLTISLFVHYCVVCQSSLHRCQQLTAFLISTLLVTKLLPVVIKSLLHPALKSCSFASRSSQ